MLQPITTLPLSEATISLLQDNGFCYVEDIRDASVSELNSACSHAIREAQKFCKVPESHSALDILREELQEYKISTLSQELDKVLDGGFRCKNITELCGAPGSGKTQICMQLCISVQLSRKQHGLNGEVLYIDTRSGVSIMRLKEMAMNCQAYFKDQEFNVDKILERIVVASPQTFDEINTVLNNFQHLIKKRQIRLILVNSLAFLRHSIENTYKRTQICFKILDDLHKLSVKHNLAVVTTNELTPQMSDNGEADLIPSGGVICAHRVHTRLMLTRLNDNEFAACVIKSSTLPKVSSKFQITSDGIRNIID